MTSAPLISLLSNKTKHVVQVWIFAYGQYRIMVFDPADPTHIDRQL